MKQHAPHDLATFGVSTLTSLGRGLSNHAPDIRLSASDDGGPGGVLKKSSRRCEKRSGLQARTSASFCVGDGCTRQSFASGRRRQTRLRSHQVIASVALASHREGFAGSRCVPLPECHLRVRESRAAVAHWVRTFVHSARTYVQFVRTFVQAGSRIEGLLLPLPAVISSQR